MIFKSIYLRGDLYESPAGKPILSDMIYKENIWISIKKWVR